MYQVIRVSVRDVRATLSRFIMPLLLALFAALPSAAPALQGDVTSDGIVTLTDALLVQQYLKGQATLDAAARARADMNNDGKANIADVIAIRLAVADSASLPVAMLPVPAGAFTMGARDDEGGDSTEFPRHQVTLSAYQIGKFAVTNGQYCEMLNWALARGYVKGNKSGGAYTGGDVYAAGQVLLYVSDSSCNIQYSGGVFAAKTRTGTGSVLFSMATHPVACVTWYGSVVFCNWLSEKEGLAPAYNASTWGLVDTDAGTSGIQFTNGYRLPTEAEWERAAGWNGTTHWIFGSQSDFMLGKYGCNYHDFNPDDVNPLGLTTNPYTSPVGWFNGINISPNGSIQTINSTSPVGAYDMCGNIWQWCHDWYAAPYDSSSQTNPVGPSSGSWRTLRGGSWRDCMVNCRLAFRFAYIPAEGLNYFGFRVARGVSAP
ncbi:MAG: SUMF1/EgtB/PvdO family nonheme iron enzyme [Candidatus Sumerlaeota bacterium]|nr:SUMF1/EgtB/PvdO family nonheme iron enzyme [Candidatus Sumerlaeota bacterium]